MLVVSLISGWISRKGDTLCKKGLEFWIAGLDMRTLVAISGVGGY